MKVRIGTARGLASMGSSAKEAIPALHRSQRRRTEEARSRRPRRRPRRLSRERRIDAGCGELPCLLGGASCGSTRPARPLHGYCVGMLIERSAPAGGGGPLSTGQFPHAAIQLTSAPWDGPATQLFLSENSLDRAKLTEPAFPSSSMSHRANCRGTGFASRESSARGARPCGWVAMAGARRSSGRRFPSTPSAQMNRPRVGTTCRCRMAAARPAISGPNGGPRKDEAADRCHGHPSRLFSVRDSSPTVRPSCP